VTTATSDPSVTPTTRVIGEFQSQRPGSTLIVIGGLHGNEPAGVIAARRILERLNSERPDRFAGRFVSFAGNLAALADPDPDLRYLDSDLNRMWTPKRVIAARERNEQDRIPEERELLQLLGVIETEATGARGPVYLLDLHSVSSESPPFVFVEDSLPARALAMRFGIPIILGFEEELQGLLVDYCTNQLGMTSLLIEGGRHDDPETPAALRHAIRIALDAIGAWPIEDAYEDPSPRTSLDRFARGHARIVYDVRYRYPIMHERFRIDPRLHAFDPVRRARTVVAIDGDRPVTPPIHGLLFLPNRQNRALPGDDGFFIVRRIGFIWLRMSASIRTRGALHRVLPMIAPGVHRDPKHEHRLLIDPDLAAALKREIFHLFGYRILRQSEDTPQTRRRRALMAVVASLRAAGGAIDNRLRGRREDLANRTDLWIVTRRRLDTERRRRVRSDR